MKGIIPYTVMLVTEVFVLPGWQVCPCTLLFHMTCKIESFLEACLRKSIPCILYAWFQKPQNTYKSMSLAFASQNNNKKNCTLCFYRNAAAPMGYYGKRCLSELLCKCLFFFLWYSWFHRDISH